MNPDSHTVTLKCSSCGAGLDITPDTDRLVCSFCGCHQKVVRSEGAVAELATEAVARVQRGTDKTAAELAVMRLRGEFAAIETERRRLIGEVLGRQVTVDNVKSRTVSWGWALLVVTTGIFFSSAFFGSRHYGISLLIIVPVILVAANNLNRRRRASDMQRELNAYTSRAKGELDERASRIKGQLGKALAVLNDTNI
jgi:hypothetical protein